MVSAFASFILGIFKFFSNFSENYDKFYESTEEYLAKNIVNGRVFYDIGKIEKRGYKAGVDYVQKEYKSKKTQDLILATNNAAEKSSKVPIVHTYILLIAGAVMLIRKYLFLQLIIILIYFPLCSFLLNLLNSNKELFVLFLIPIALLFVFIETGLIKYILDKESGKKLSIGTAYAKSISSFYRVILLFLLLVFITSSIFLFLFYSGNLLMTAFKQREMLLFIKVPIVYFVVFISLFLIFGAIYIFQIFTGAIYTAVVKEQGTVDSLIIASHIYKKRTAEALSIFLIYLTSVSLFIFMLVVYLSDFALLYGITLSVHVGFLFIYLFNRYLWTGSTGELGRVEVSSASKIVFTASIFVSVIGYIAFVSQALSSYPKIESVYSAWKTSREIESNSINFVNKEAGYTLVYTKDWKLYTWNTNSVTFHKNINNTKSGELAINIIIRQNAGSDFERLDSVMPGTVISNLETGEDSTKFYNMVVDGFEAIKYTTARPVPGYLEQKIVYLIKRGDKFYEINMTAKDAVFLQDNQKVFDSIVSSVEFE